MAKSEGLNHTEEAEMSKSILFELFNLSGAAGTGIATYARNLVQTASSLGYEVDGLFHTHAKLNVKDPVLAEVAFFDARNRKPSAIYRWIESNWRRGIGAPMGMRPTRLKMTGVVLDPSKGGGSFLEYRNAYAAHMFMDLSRFHFKRYKHCVKLRVPTKPDIFHATQAVPIMVPGAINIYTIHDLVPLRLPYTTLDDKKFFLEMVRHLGRSADHIVTVSEASRRDLIEIAGIAADKITNTYQAVSIPDEHLAMTQVEIEGLLNTFDLKYRKYFLFYGAIEPKKNVARIVDAHAASGTPHPLIIAGGLGWEYENDLEHIENNKSPFYRVFSDKIIPSQKVRRLGRLPQAQLIAMIRGARAVLFPSLYEGFGLPVLESMLLGTPVITSNVSSLIEVSGDAALLADPFNVRDISRAVQKLDGDESLRMELSARGKTQAEKFSPGVYKSRMDALYSGLIDAKGR